MSIQYRELKRRYQLDGPQKTVEHLSEALRERHLAPDDFSLRDLAEALVPDGGEWVRLLDPRSGGSTVLEAADGVDLSAFQNVAGQVIYSKILDAYQQSAFVVSKLVSTIPTRLDGEKIPGAGKLADTDMAVAPGMPYPHLGFGEDYIETPATTKRGFIVPVTKEAIFFDRTNLVLRRASEVGELLGLNKEKRLLDLVIGVTNNYKWRGTSYNTYQSSTPWVNELASNELVDWENVDAAEQLLADILDPNTGEPVMLGATSVLVMPAYRHAAHRVFNAAEIHYTGTDANTSTVAANPLGNYTVAESRLAYRRVVASGVAAGDAKKWWFLGDFRKAFAYMENWPITVTQAPRGSEAEFTSDIVLRFKASERGAAAVIDPRYVVKCTG
ncbi:phage major capsid protein [Aeoliella sp. SH292]|uniref:phage major capsid protein n=1 Tax=Aeoliella sp. SH292 TaxID=3454464 RepID=UPI003F977D31